VDELLKRDYNVVIFDDQSTGNNYNPQARTIIGDVTVKEDFDLIDVQIDYIVHFAAAISVAESMGNPSKYYKINFEGSRNILEWAVKNNVKRVVSASSAAVYGTPQSLPVREDDKLAPISPYAETKMHMEVLQKKFFMDYGLSSTCLRFFNVYGPRQSPRSPYSGVISKFLELAHEQKDLTIFGDGSTTRDFVYVGDVAKANIMALEKGTGFAIYNVGTESVTTLKGLADTVIHVTGSNSHVKYMTEREGDIKKSLSDCHNIKEALGWTPTVNLEEGLKLTYEWYLSTMQKQE